MEGQLQPEALPPAGRPERRILWTAALSLLVHAALVATLGRAGLESAADGLVHRLEVVLERPRESPVAAETGEAPATDVDHAIAAIEPPAASAEPAALPLALAVPAAAAWDVVTTIAESAFSVPVFEPGPAEPTAPALREITPAQREMLGRRIGAWLRDFDASDPRRLQLSWQQDGRQYTVELKGRQLAGATGFERIDVEVVMAQDGSRWRTGLSFRQLAFSHFAQFVDRWDSDVQLHDDEVAGRFHANTAIIVGYDRKVAPRFLGTVTTSAGGFRLANTVGERHRDEIFVGGLETGVERILLPQELRPFADADDAQVRRFESDTRIRFHADGSYSWNELSGDAGGREPLPRGAAHLVAADGRQLRVSGTLRGQVLVYAPDRIVIEGDLRYARDPRAEPGSEDVLGLVSDRYVIVAGPETIQRGDLEIHAAIYARRRFSVSRQDARHAGTLRIYGSLTAGTISATEPRYATQLEFDPRFDRMRPPGYPLASRYELDGRPAGWTPLEEPGPL